MYINTESGHITEAEAERMRQRAEDLKMKQVERQTRATEAGGVIRLDYYDYDAIERGSYYEVIRWNEKSVTVKEVRSFRDDHGGQAWGTDKAGEAKRLKLEQASWNGDELDGTYFVHDGLKSGKVFRPVV